MGEETARELHEALYRAAKANAERTFHALRVEEERCMSGYGRRVNTVGEPDAGNPLVRFDGGMLESWRWHAPASYPTLASNCPRRRRT
jgi:hypothetical protein